MKIATPVAATSFINELFGSPGLSLSFKEHHSYHNTARHTGPITVADNPLTGMGRSAIYRDQTFPKPVKIGERMVAWREDEIRQWINQRVTAQS